MAKPTAWPLAWLAAALVATAALVLTSRGPDTPPPQPLPYAPSQAPDRGPIAVGAPLPPPARTTPAGLPPQREMREPAISAQLAGGARRVSGTIRVLVPGGEHVPRAGRIVFAARSSASLGSGQVTASVADGTWVIDAPLGADRLTVAEAVLDGRLARCDQPIAVHTLRGPVALLAQWADAHTLRVVDAFTGQDLDRLTVVRARDTASSELTHPGAFAFPVPTDGMSPLCLPVGGRLDSSRLWIRAPEHAWNHVTLAPGETGERVLPLHPGGDLEVAILGLPAGTPGVWLCAQPAGSAGETFRATVADESDTVRIDGLVAGSWTLRLEQRRFASEPGTVLGTTVAIVVPGIVPLARIVVKPPREPARTTLRGTLRVDAAWGDKVSLCLAATGEAAAWTRTMVILDAASMTRGPDGALEFGPVALHAGRYELVVRPCGHAQLVEVGPGPTRVDVVTPVPYAGIVQLHDENGRPVSDARVAWSRAVDGIRPGLLRTPARPRRGGGYELLAPAGPITVAAEHPDFAESSSTLTMSPGGGEITLRLLRAFGAEIVLKHGATVVPVASATLAHTATNTRSTGEGERIAATLPGPHVLTIGPIDGFLPVPPRHVDLAPGTWTRVEIALQRTH